MPTPYSTDGHYRPRILVIDDEPAFTRLLKINLEATDRYVVRVETDSTLAFAAALAFRPDLVLLDVMMPGLDGGDIATLFSKHDLLKKVPIIFLTATVKQVEVAEHQGSFGGFHFLSKPVDISELTECLAKQLGDLKRSIWMHYA